MKRVLFVSNGHGEISIVRRIAAELHGIAADHLALVGGPAGSQQTPQLREAGPRRAMPSGGLIAMGNVRNIMRDVRAGLLSHTLAQLRFLRGASGAYDAAVAVGDTFALVMARCAQARATVYVGTAKSAHVAPYGPIEELFLRKVQAVFVRDERTAQLLRSHGVDARAANVIVDLFPAADSPPDPHFDPCLALFPGSRETAYGDAVLACRIVRELARERHALGAVLSVAPGLDAARMAADLAHDGWRTAGGSADCVPFELYAGERNIVRAWSGPLGAMLRGAALVIGQAGTANEAAAAAGIPVIACEHPGKQAWYRKRQIGLLGEALRVVDRDPVAAAHAVGVLLDDEPARRRMSEAGRERMGPPGAAASIGRVIEQLCA